MMGYGLYGSGKQLKGKKKKGNKMKVGGGLSGNKTSKGRNNAYDKWLHHGLSVLNKRS